MNLQIGDRITDETGEWEVVGRPYTTNAGKDVHVRVQKVGQPDVTEIHALRRRADVLPGERLGRCQELGLNERRSSFHRTKQSAWNGIDVASCRAESGDAGLVITIIKSRLVMT